REHPDRGGVQPQEQVRIAVQGDRDRQGAAKEPVHADADARVRARAHRPEHRPAGPGVHLHARARDDEVPPGRGHGVQDPRRAALANPKSPQIFAEASLDSTLQSGQLDAASAYINQAVELHLPYIKLPADINLGDPAQKANYAKASITITTSAGKATKMGSPLAIDITTIGTPTPAGIAFVKYTLSPAGLALYQQGGYTVFSPPTVVGTGLPAAVQSE